MKTYRQFGLVTVTVQIKDNATPALDTESSVKLNWSFIGEVSIEDAESFLEDLSRAISYAVTQRIL